MEIRTERLLLREMRAGDLEALYALYSDPIYQRYEGELLSQESVSEKLERYLGWAGAEPRTRYIFAITTPPEDKLIGRISLSEINAAIREWEIGWGIAPACWRMGYATEAARALLGFAFHELRVHRVTAFCHADNRASARVMEKIEMQNEGRLRQVRWIGGKWWDELVYAIVEEDEIRE